MSLAMSKVEREAFLADVHVGVVAIERSGEPPLAVPVWYDYDPAVGVWFVTEASSQKARALRAAGRCSLCAQSEEPGAYRYVSVEGPIVEARPSDLERDRRPMAHRYLGPQRGDAYADGVPGEDNLVFVMRPERWRTVDYRKLSL